MRLRSVEAILLSILNITAMSGAATLTVPAQYATIQEAVNAASNGDTILVSDGTYSIGGPYHVVLIEDKAVHLKSVNGPGNTILESLIVGGNSLRITGTPGSCMVVEGFTITATANHTVCVLINTTTEVTLRNCIIEQCSNDTGNGGGLVNSGTLVVDDTIFRQNSVYGHGGAIFNEGQLTLNNTIFDGNGTLYDGADPYAYGGAIHNTDVATVNIMGCSFSTNTAVNGGALSNRGTMNIRNALFVANNAVVVAGSEVNGGGAIFNEGPGSFNAYYATFFGNLAAGSGASIHVDGGSGLVMSSILWDDPDDGIVVNAGASFGVHYSDVTLSSGTYPGVGNLNQPPLFTGQTGAEYTLSHTVAGQAQTSPCVDTGLPGFATGDECNIGAGPLVCLDNFSTRTDRVGDTNIIDMGYHYSYAYIMSTDFERGCTCDWSAVVGLSNPTTWTCDPVEQDCVAETEGCYLYAITGETSCAGIPAGAEGVVQDMACYGPGPGVCFLNGCDKGFGANQPDNTCAFFCNPIDNWSGAVQGLTGDPAGITCAATFGDVRPDGPGPSYECRYLQSFYSNTDLVAATTGMCVLPAKVPMPDWGAYGTCADFDWVQLQSDINDGTAAQQGYCTDICPQCCMPECISLATWDAAFPAKSGKSNYSCFSEKKEIREQYCGLE